MNLEKELKPRLRQAELPELTRLAKLYAGDKLVIGRVAIELHRRQFRAETYTNYPKAYTK
jgi:hypothetical protein